MKELANNLLAAGGLVPCDGTGQNPCTYIDFFYLINNVVEFAVYLAVPLGTIAIVAAGIIMVMYSSNEGKRTMAKSILMTAVIGIVLTLSAYLIISTIIKVLADPSVVQL